MLRASATSGILLTVGDVLAQRLGMNADEHKSFAEVYDPLRTSRMTLTGILINGPYFSSVYRAMDWAVDALQRRKEMPAALSASAVQAQQKAALVTSELARRFLTPALVRATQKSLFTHFVAFPPYLVMLLSFTKSLEWIQNDWEEQKQDRPPLLPLLSAHIREKAWPMFAAGSMLWPFVGVINFRYFSGNARIVFMGTVSLGWNSFLSWSMAPKRHAQVAAAAAAAGPLAMMETQRDRHPQPMATQTLRQNPSCVPARIGAAGVMSP